ncbi:hypothetical protein [Bradyrhizobium cenepequi]|nr:hypothetical protein [Bradyrhizobium cenepequi]MCA6109735.1 hypothetical protein [Bradyrhizobium cenepequi]
MINIDAHRECRKCLCHSPFLNSRFFAYEVAAMSALLVTPAENASRGR